MSYIITFFIGSLAACLSLITQVFVSTVAELFFRISITFQYSPSDTMKSIVIIMLLAATIEEFLRYFVVKKIALGYVKNMLSPIIYGFLLGAGFAGFETVLISLGQISINAQTIASLMPLYVIHIIASILFLYLIKPETIIKKDLLYILLIISFHAIGNMALFYYLLP